MDGGSDEEAEDEEEEEEEDDEDDDEDERGEEEELKSSESEKRSTKKQKVAAADEASTSSAVKLHTCAFCAKQLKPTAKRYAFTSDDEGEYVSGRPNLLGPKKVKGSRYVCDSCYKENDNLNKGHVRKRGPRYGRQVVVSESEASKSEGEEDGGEKESEKEEKDGGEKEKEEKGRDGEREAQDDTESEDEAKPMEPPTRKELLQVQALAAAAVLTRAGTGPLSEATLRVYIAQAVEKFRWALTPRGVVACKRRQAASNLEHVLHYALHASDTFLGFNREPGSVAAWSISTPLPLFSPSSTPSIPREFLFLYFLPHTRS